MKHTYSVYQVNVEQIDSLKKVGFDFLPYKINNSSTILGKFKHFAKKSDLVNFMFNFYQSKEWQKYMIQYPIMLESYEAIGFKFKKIYDENNNVKKIKIYKNDSAYDFCKAWYLAIDTSEETPLLYLSHPDITAPDFYNSYLLDNYCKSEVNRLLKLKLIKKIYISQEESDEE
jgi:hypothetical protein